MNREDQLFVDLLKKTGYSITEPRKEMFKLLRSGSAKSVNEIVSVLPFNRSTTYRTLELLQKLGVVTEVHLGWKHKYELSDIFQHHHHHLTCNKCGRVIALEEDSILEDEITRLSKRYKFEPTDHQLEIRGICSRH